MKYSLTSLLLEDIGKREIGSRINPDPDDVEGAWMLDVGSYAKKALELAVDKLGPVAMNKLYEISNSYVKGLIEKTRKMASVKKAEVDTLLNDTSLETQIIKVFTDGSDDEKKNMAVCLGFLESASPRRVYKWQKSAGETDEQFHDQIRQGCREIRIASAIVTLSDLESYIYRMNGEIREEVTDSMLQRVRNAAGIKGGEFQLDLAEDPEIKPILKSLRRAKRGFSSLYDDEGNASVFTHPTLDIALDPETNKVVFKQCSDNLTKYTFNESKEDRWLQVLVERVVRPTRIDEADARTSEESEVTADSPTTIPQAIGQLILRYNPALNIIQRLQDVQRNGGLTTQAVIDIVKPVSSFGKLPLSFPRADGTITRQPITTQGSIPITRSAAGIVSYFIMGGRKKAISMDVVKRVAEVLGVEFTLKLDPSLENHNDPRPVVSMHNVMRTLEKSGGTLEKLSSEAKEALSFVIAAVAEYSGTASGSSSRDGMIPGASQFSSQAYEQYINYLAMRSALRSQNPDIESLKGGVIFEPGRKRRPGEKNVISTIRAYPTLSDIEKNDEFLANAGGEESESSAINIKQAKNNLDKLLKMLGSLPAALKRATSPLRRAPVRGHLPAIEFSTLLAAVAEGIRIPEAFRKLGYSSSLLIARDDIEPRDVWILLCESSGASVGSAIDVTFSDTTSYDQLLPEMSGGNLEKVISHLAALYTSHYVNPLARVIMHAANTYRDRGELGSNSHEKMIERLDDVFSQALAAIRRFQFDAPTTTGVQTVTGAGRILRRAVALRKKSTLGLGAVPAEYKTVSRTDPLASPMKSTGKVDMKMTAAEGAPFNVSISTLSIGDDGVEAAAPDASAAPTAAPTPTPTPVPTPTPPPAPVPPASSEPAAASNDASLSVKYVTEGFKLPDFDSKTVFVYIKIVRDQIKPRSNSTLSFALNVKMRGGTSQISALTNPSTLLFEGSVYSPVITVGSVPLNHRDPLLNSAFEKFTRGGTLKEVVDAALVVALNESLRDISGNVSGFTVNLMNSTAPASSPDNGDDEDTRGDYGL